MTETTHPYPYSIKRHGTTLEKCEHEPVQTPGCIQAHGVLLVLRLTDLAILQVSENLAEWLGRKPSQVLGSAISGILGESRAATLRRALASEPVERTPLYLFTLAAGESGNARALHASIHTNAGLALLELEDAGLESSPQEPDYYGLVRKPLNRFQSARSLRELAQTVTEEIRTETGLDRVMVYFFHADESGQVIAEARREDLNSWLGWRYPAHDIPKPAREIFKRIWSRPVPDVKGALHEVVPLLNPETRAPLDMTYCALRGASVMYTEYLANMGVAAALTLPLVMEGELWGLIACHHYTPCLMSHRTRAAAEFLAKAASQQLRLAEEREQGEYRTKVESTIYALIAKVNAQLEYSAFTDGDLTLLDCLDADGAALFHQGTWHRVGKCPTLPQLEELGTWLAQLPEMKGAAVPLVSTDHLDARLPSASAYAGVGSGLLAFRFSDDPVGIVAWFKPETLQTFTWAGNPHELPVVAGPHGPRLTPRQSFEIWRETVHHRSLPWKKVELEGAVRLRQLIIDLIVSRAEEMDRLRSALRLSRARFDISLDAAQLGAWEFNLQQRDLWRTPYHDLIFGYEQPLAHWDFQRWIDHIDSQERPAAAAKIEKALAANATFDLETRIRTAKGEARWIWIHGSPIRSSVQKTYVGLVRDITETVKARELLAVKGRELQTLVDERTAELTATIGELEAFSYSISHDMRSPLRAMQGFSKALMEEYHDKLDAEGQDYLGRIERGSKRLDLLIRDVLSYSKVSKGEIVLRPMLLRGLVEEIILSHGELQEPRATMTLDLLDVPVMGHEAFLSQVFANLLGNAVKFMPTGRKPVVTVRSELVGREQRVWIGDNGIGVAPEHRERIFQIFGRIYPERRFEGTGIGLSIVRKAVERMGGEIGVESEVDQGSRFWFTLKSAL